MNPQVVLQLPKLSILMASCNQITSLPAGIGACSNLQAIVLQSNSIAELPSSISNLVDLKALGLASNKIHGPLPEFLGSCTTLRLLDISSNQITSLPTSMGRLQKLKTLKASNNQLPSIPHQFRDIRILQELYLEGNPFQLQGPGHEPQAFNASSTSAVKKVLDMLLPGTQVPSLAAEPLAAVQEQLPQQEQAQQHQCPQQQSPQPQQAPQQHSGQQQQLQQPNPQPPPPSPPSPLPQHQQQQQQEQQQQQQQQQQPQSRQSSQPGSSPLPPNSPLGSIGREDRDAQSLVAQIGRLSMSHEKPPSAQITPKESIVTAESAEGEAAKRQLHEQASKDHAQHADTIAQDPLRAKAASGWDNVPLTDIPRLLAAMSNPPPPPPPMDNNGGAQKRPQTMQRFRRVVDQSNMAVRLLGRVGSELGQQQQQQQQQQQPPAPLPQQQ
ncbi:hypothetical protein DUNSADRAFT_9641 [Dunaliella salina]|uniref:Uncharacterized protein n=1 Tax=Dunaliella salina TaxID=3046 RepID=A0ABQ7GH15_DUNSA|nr:hypothetical protein DUNSADRAFT_9641 [Dunaliella salina]|eukprot:KAF5833894.1 hypothetical protein DUNSADRAFT_9641 [Dunaliella salina]